MLEESVKLPAIVHDDIDRTRAFCEQARQLVTSSKLLLGRLLREHADLQRALTEKLREVVSSYQKSVARRRPLPSNLRHLIEASGSS